MQTQEASDLESLRVNKEEVCSWPRTNGMEKTLPNWLNACQSAVETEVRSNSEKDICGAGESE